MDVPLCSSETSLLLGEDSDEAERDEDVNGGRTREPKVDEPSEPSGSLSVQHRAGREEDDHRPESSGERRSRDQTEGDRVGVLLGAGTR